MKKTISIIRIAILTILCGIAMVLIFGEEQDESVLWFLLHITLDKGIGIGICFWIGKLYTRWSKVDPWIMAYDKMCNNIMDEENPSQI